MKVRSGLREGQRADYPPSAAWLERQQQDYRRRERHDALSMALTFAILAIGGSSLVWAVVDALGRWR